MCAIFMDQSKVQRKAAVKGSPSLSDPIPPPETLGGLRRTTAEDTAQLLSPCGKCVSFHWDTHPFGMLLTHELPAWNDHYL